MSSNLSSITSILRHKWFMSHLLTTVIILIRNGTDVLIFIKLFIGNWYRLIFVLFFKPIWKFISRFYFFVPLVMLLSTWTLRSTWIVKIPSGLIQLICRSGWTQTDYLLSPKKNWLIWQFLCDILFEEYLYFDVLCTQQKKRTVNHNWYIFIYLHSIMLQVPSYSTRIGPIKYTQMMDYLLSHATRK
jgi:hypothetical protein